jgi:hypothetical protein
MSASERAPGRRRRAWRPAAIALAGLLVAEIACRIAVPGSASGSRAVVASMELPLPERSDVPETPHPYFGWSRADWRERFAVEAGYFAGEEARRAFDVLLVGGGLAAGQRDALAAALARELGYARGEQGTDAAGVRVLDLTDARLVPPQVLHLVSYVLLLGWRPDAVLRIDGGEALAVSLDNARRGVHPIYPWTELWAAVDRSGGADRETAELLVDARRSQRAASRVLRTAERWGLLHSALASLVVQQRLEDGRSRFERQCAAWRARVASRPRPSQAGPAFDAGTAGPLALRSALETSVSLDAICRERSIGYLHVLRVGAGDADPTAAQLLRELGDALLAAGIDLLDASETERLDGAAVVERIAAALFRERDR